MSKTTAEKGEPKMPNELKPCECVIGVWFDYDETDIVTEKALFENIDNRNRIYKREFYTPRADYFDDEKEVNFQRFVFCPFCGKKIDWDAIRRRTDNEQRADCGNY